MEKSHIAHSHSVIDHALGALRSKQYVYLSHVCVCRVSFSRRFISDSKSLGRTYTMLKVLPIKPCLHTAIHAHTENTSRAARQLVIDRLYRIKAPRVRRVSLRRGSAVVYSIVCHSLRGHSPHTTKPHISIQYIQRQQNVFLFVITTGSL